MSNSSLKHKSLKGSLWSLIDNISSQGFAFMISIVLARLLSPTDYGTVGVLAIFLAIANVFVDCGFANALIRKKDRTQEDLSTAFYFNISVGVIVYLILFFIAPFVAGFFNMPILVSLLRVLAFCVVFNSLSLVQNAILIAHLQIKTLAIINVCTQIPMGCIGIYFAYKGFGVWTLVIQQVGSSLLKTWWLWINSKWRPSSVFSMESFRYLYDFGWKLLGANLFGTVFNELYGFVIGRMLGASDLGYYAKSKQLAEHPRSVVNNIVNRVVLPVMIESQGDIIKTREIYRKLIQMMSFVIFPLFGLLILIAEPLITSMWTDKWKETVPLFQMFCIGMSFGPISALNFCLLQLLNRTDLILKLEFIKKPACLFMLLISLPFGLKGIVLFASMYNIVGAIINMYPTNKLIEYSYSLQFRDILLSLSVTTGLIVIIYYPMSLIADYVTRIMCSMFSFLILYALVGLILNRSQITVIKSYLYRI